jgi:DNA-binding NarL/FixJ family response regulator
MGSLVLDIEHLVFLDALSTALGRQGHQAEAVAGTASGLAETVRQQQPDACVISFDATARTCGEFSQHIRTASSAPSIHVISGHTDRQVVPHALESGAAGQVSKSFRPGPSRLRIQLPMGRRGGG